MSGWFFFNFRNVLFGGWGGISVFKVQPYKCGHWVEFRWWVTLPKWVKWKRSWRSFLASASGLHTCAHVYMQTYKPTASTQMELECYYCVFVHVPICVCMKGGGAHAKVCMWRSEDNFVELLLPIHLYLGSGDQILLPDLYSKVLYLLSHFAVSSSPSSSLSFFSFSISSSLLFKIGLYSLLMYEYKQVPLKDLFSPSVSPSCYSPQVSFTPPNSLPSRPPPPSFICVVNLTDSRNP